MSDTDGILAALNVSVGANVNKGDVIATLYARDKLQLKVEVNEADLSALTEGTPVEIRFNWNEDAEDAASLPGTVRQVLYTAVEAASGDGMSESGSASDSASYIAYIDFDADEDTRIGMTAVVRPVSAEDAAPDAEEASDAEVEG